ncbi:MAG: hypothetical protein V1847_02680 [Candidatus Diapherotrites archaeon]
MRLYVDSNVLISYVLQEIGKSGNVMFQDVGFFFEMCRLAKHELVLSDLCVKEVKGKTFFKTEEIFVLLEGIRVIFASVEESDEILAASILRRFGIHWLDALHAAIAVRMGCDGIVSWNWKDFQKTNSLVKVYLPSEFV